MHRVGGLEKQDGTGNVSYDADNHQKMTNIRAQKVANVAEMIPPQQVFGPEQGELLVLSWAELMVLATPLCRRRLSRSQCCPLPSASHESISSNLGQILGRYDSVLIPELNNGQLKMLIRSKYLVDATGFNKVKGKPFTVTELLEKIFEMTSAEGAADVLVQSRAVSFQIDHLKPGNSRSEIRS